MKRYFFAVALFFCCVVASAQISKTDIDKIVAGKQADVGVAVLYEDETFLYNNHLRYPLMSVFKLHVAVTALKKMEHENISLDSVVVVSSEQLHDDTYSPLRDESGGKDTKAAFRKLFEYTISLRDNNTCDYLIDFAGGIEAVDSYVESLGIKDFNLTETEKSMNAVPLKSYDNWSTPLSTALFMKKIYTENILSDEHLAFLEQIMIATSSGRDKMRAGLPEQVRLGHKTGHSGRLPDGTRMAENDAGVIYLPDGRKCFIVVFVQDSAESDEVNAKIIAEIAAAVYDSLS